MISDPSAAWMGLAASFVLQQDLATSRNILPLFAVDQSSAYLAGATETLRLTVERHGTGLHISGSAFDLTTQRSIKVFEAESNSPDDLLAPVEKVARQLGSEPLARFSTANPKALKPFTEAVVAQSPQLRTQLLESALALDPSFGLARTALAETIGPPALQNVDDTRFTPFDRARWTAVKARLTNAPPPQQMEAQRAILKLSPNNVDALATLGTLQFLSGDRAGGERLLKQAIGLNPSNLALQVQLKRLGEQKQ